VAIILFVIFIMAYKTFFPSDQAVADQGADATAIGNDIIALDQSLSKVTLDLSLFNTSTYKALVDFSPTVTPQPVGRAHPFNPIGK